MPLLLLLLLAYVKSFLQSFFEIPCEAVVIAECANC